MASRAAATGGPARVLLVDDSAVSRTAVARILGSDAAIRVVGHAADGEAAIAAVTEQPVDVVILDIEMPGMNGLEALPLLLRARPGLRVIMVSVLTTKGAATTLRAMRLGAADYIAKPSASDAAGEEFRTTLIAKVKGLAFAGHATALPRAGRTPVSLAGPPMRPPLLLAIGSSTGGPQALFTLFQALGREVPVPVILTQHMPPMFIPILAEQLDRLGGLPCQVAESGMRLVPGSAFLAPGSRHLLVHRQGDDLVAELSDGPPEHHCRPAVDPMLRSAAAASRGATLVIMLTGMGSDGLAGTRAVIEAGGCALAQDEASSVVWGMPGAVAQAGLCHVVAPVAELAHSALALLSPKTFLRRAAR